MLQRHGYKTPVEVRCELTRKAARFRSALVQETGGCTLAYLATAAPRGFHSRDTLLALFWPEADQERARNALRQALFYLRRSLDEDVVIGRGDREVGIAPEGLWCDAGAFDDAVAEGRHEDALALYRGDLLPGFFIEDAPEVERWLDEERSRRRRVAVETAWLLAEREEAKGDLPVAAQWSRRAASFAPQDENSLRRLLGVFERAGEAVAALGAFGDFARHLEQEYGLAPSGETKAIVDRIRTRLQPEPVDPEPTQGEQKHEPAVLEAPRHSPPPPAKALAFPKGGSVWKRPGAVVVAALLIALGGWHIARDRPVQPESVHTATPLTVAVLPFANLSSGAEDEYFADGISEELLGLLGQIPELRVVARTSSFSFKGKSVPIDSIGRALNAQYVLEGSVRRERDRVRVLAQLVEAQTGYLLWNQSYDRDLSDIFAVQTEISRVIGEQLRIRLEGGRAPALASHGTSDPEAHLLALKGWHLRHQANTEEDHAQAASFFEEAIQRDPTYARAYAGLAGVLLIQARRGFIAREEGYSRAAAAVQRALELEPDLAAAHAVSSRIVEARDWEFASATAHAERAVVLDPNDVSAQLRKVGLLLRLRRFDEAVSTAERAVELDPVSGMAHSHLGWAHFASGRYEDALRSMQAALDLSPGDGISLIEVAIVHAQLGRYAEAIRMLEQGRSRLRDDPWAHSYAVRIYAAAGRLDEAERALRSLEALPRSSPYLRAVAHAALGHREETFRLLGEAVEGRDDLVPDLAMDRAFDPLRNDPRMDQLLRTIGLR